MSNSTLNKSIFLPASRETVWSFLTEKEKLKQWFLAAETDLEDKQDYALIKTGEDGKVNRICWGSVLEMDRPRHLKYSFTVNDLAGALTIVTWTLETVDGGTKLSLTHEGVSEAAGEAAMRLILALDKGWDEHLGRLRDAARA